MTATPIDGATGRQFMRFATVGLAANAALYLGYLLLTSQGIEHKAAMTITYCAGVSCTFVLQRRWTFAHDGDARAALLRYLALYAAAYVFQLAALTVAVDSLALPHAWVMAVLIPINAILIFAAQKFWVFSAKRSSALR
jgi:putative flippase GtrA